jgi:hypothetical protein
MASEERLRDDPGGDGLRSRSRGAHHARAGRDRRRHRQRVVAHHLARWAGATLCLERNRIGAVPAGTPRDS